MSMEDKLSYENIIETARKNLGQYCKGCYVCNGKACKNQIPGPGAKGAGYTAIRNYEKWQEICVNMDTICDNKDIDTSCTFFSRNFSNPIFAGPVGAVNMHYGSLYTDVTYNELLVSACAKAKIAAFTGDGTDDNVMKSAADAIMRNDGAGIPTIKPWNMDKIMEKLELVHSSKAFAAAMDIDAVGLPFLQNQNPPAGSKNVCELRKIVSEAGVPFIIKGIMTVKGALKAKEAGAAAIVVSNHGGRVLDQCPSTAEVLKEISDAVGDSMTVLVDGGIRSGIDIFKALALGADGVLICRPMVVAAYGGGEEGIITYINKLSLELKDTMKMCGAHNIDDITIDMIRR